MPRLRSRSGLTGPLDLQGPSDADDGGDDEVMMTPNANGQKHNDDDDDENDDDDDDDDEDDSLSEPSPPPKDQFVNASKGLLGLKESLINKRLIEENFETIQGKLSKLDAKLGQTDAVVKKEVVGSKEDVVQFEEVIEQCHAIETRVEKQESTAQAQLELLQKSAGAASSHFQSLRGKYPDLGVAVVRLIPFFFFDREHSMLDIHPQYKELMEQDFAHVLQQTSLAAVGPAPSQDVTVWQGRLDEANEKEKRREQELQKANKKAEGYRANVSAVREQAAREKADLEKRLQEAEANVDRYKSNCVEKAKEAKKYHNRKLEKDRQLMDEAKLRLDQEKQLKAAEERLQQYERKIQQKDKENAGLSETVSTLTRAKEGTSSAIGTLRSTVNALRDQQEKAKQTYDETLADITADAKEGRKELEDRIQLLEREKRDVEVQLGAEKSRVAELRADVESLQGEGAKLRNEKSQLRVRLDQVRNELSEQIGQVEQLQSCNEELQEQHQKDAARLDALRKQTRQTFQQDEQYRSLLRAKEELEVELKKDAQTHATKVFDLNSKCRGLETTILQKEEELKSERDEIARMTKSWQQSRKLYHEARSEARKHGQKVSDLEGEVSLVNESLTKEQEQNESLQKKLLDGKKSLEAAERRNRELTDDIARNGEYAEDLKKRWEETNERLKMTRQERRQLQEGFRKREDQLNEGFRQKENELKEEANGRVEAMMEKKRQQQEEANGRLEALRQEIRHQQEEARGRLEAMLKEKRQLQERFEEEKRLLQQSFRQREDELATVGKRQLQDFKRRMQSFWTQLACPVTSVAVEECGVFVDSLLEWGSRAQPVQLGPVHEQKGHWMILDSWMDDDMAGPETLQPSLSNETCTMASLLLDVYRFASSGLVDGQECQIRVRRLIELVSTCSTTTVQVEMFAASARLFVAAVLHRPAESIAVAVAFWQLMAIVEQRWSETLAWGQTKEALEAYLEGHEYSVMFEIVLGRKEVREETGCRFWADSVAVYSQKHATTVLLVDIQTRSLRLIAKERCHVDWLETRVQPPVMKQQEVISLKVTKDDDCMWAFLYLC